MRTAQEMYEYCLENGFGQGHNKKKALKNFQLIAENLQDEEVLMTFLGIHNYSSEKKHHNSFAYTLTDQRLIVAQKRIVGKTITTVLLNMFNDVSLSIDDTLGIIEFDTIVEKFNVGVDKEQAEYIQNKMQTLISKNNGNRKKDNKENKINEVVKYKALLDKGSITEEEFKAKKKELLGIKHS